MSRLQEPECEALECIDCLREEIAAIDELPEGECSLEDLKRRDELVERLRRKEREDGCES